MGETLTGDRARFTKGLHEVGDRTWAWLQPNGRLGEANAGLVVGDSESLLVDTLWDQKLAREMLEAMEPRVRDAPVRTVFNTHSDGDHWWGNAEAPAAATIITGEKSLEAMREDVSPRGLRLLTGTLAATSRLPGPPGARARAAHAKFAPYDFAGVTLRHPDRTFDRRETLDVGGREVRLIEVGPAHTPGDAIVHVPDARVVFAADILFVGVTPIMWAGPVDNWLRALDTLIDLDADAYVPGHGPVAGRAEIEDLAAYWRHVRDAAAEHHRAGASRMEAARAIRADPSFARFRDWDESERIVVNVDVIYKALDGTSPAGSRSPSRLALFRDMGELAAED